MRTCPERADDERFARREYYRSRYETARNISAKTSNCTATSFLRSDTCRFPTRPVRAAPMITNIVASDRWAWRAADGTKHILLIPVLGFCAWQRLNFLAAALRQYLPITATAVVAHRVTSRRHSDLVAFGSKRTLSKPLRRGQCRLTADLASPPAPHRMPIRSRLQQWPRLVATHVLPISTAWAEGTAVRRTERVGKVAACRS